MPAICIHTSPLDIMGAHSSSRRTTTGKQPKPQTYLFDQIKYAEDILYLLKVSNGRAAKEKDLFSYYAKSRTASILTSKQAKVRKIIFSSFFSSIFLFCSLPFSSFFIFYFFIFHFDFSSFLIFFQEFEKDLLSYLGKKYLPSNEKNKQNRKKKEPNKTIVEEKKRKRTEYRRGKHKRKNQKKKEIFFPFQFHFFVCFSFFPSRSFCFCFFPFSFLFCSFFLSDLLTFSLPGIMKLTSDNELTMEEFKRILEENLLPEETDFPVMVVGSRQCGKSSFIDRCLGNSFFFFGSK